MKTSKLLQKINIPRHKLYYLEQKGFITPKRIPMGDLEARDYSQSDFEKIKAIWIYLQQGFKHKTAYKKAMKDLQRNKQNV